MTNATLLLLTSTALLALRGGFFLLLLFSFCFLTIHFVAFLLSKKKPKAPPVEPEKEKAPIATAQPEPVYYIVERKQRRNKAQYGEPKEIKFK